MMRASTTAALVAPSPLSYLSRRAAAAAASPTRRLSRSATAPPSPSPRAVAPPPPPPPPPARAVRARLQRAEQLLQQVRADAARTAPAAPSAATAATAARQRLPLAGELPPAGASAATEGASSAQREEEATAREEKRADEGGPRYDAQSAMAYFRDRRLFVSRRQLQLAVPLTSFVSRVVLDVQLGREPRNRALRARQFLEIVSSLGPAIIKGGQAVASRPDLLPKEYLDELQKLQDRLPPFENELAFALIEEELGQSVEDIFESIDPVPVAAASIGQVYSAVLKGTGERVAVKVQRPNCEQIIAMDIYILRNLSGTINQLLKLTGRNIDLQSIIEEFGKLIYEEIDYLSEARNAERFMELYGDLPGVDIPRIFWRYTKRRVITMEWMDGSRLNSESLSKERSEELVRAMVQCSLRQILDNGYFHADTHLGNLLAMPSGNLCYLDFGMMSEVEPNQRYGIIEAVVHMVNRDFDALAKLYVRLGFLPADTELEPIVEALNDALPDVLGASVGELNFKSVIDKLGSVMYKYPFTLPPYYTAIIRCLGVLEGVAIQVDPNFKILNESYPYIASRLLTDPAPELQEALQALLFDQGLPRWNRLESLLDSASKTGDYDASLAIEQLLSFLLSPQGKLIRYNLADELTFALDTLGVDVLKYYASVAAQAGSTVGMRLPIALAGLPPPEKSAAMENAERVAAILGRSRGFSPAKITPLLRRLVRDPESQRLGAEIAVSLAERITSRAVRFAFGLSQEPMRGPSP